jgi:hypothetical protein
MKKVILILCICFTIIYGGKIIDFSEQQEQTQDAPEYIIKFRQIIDTLNCNQLKNIADKLKAEALDSEKEQDISYFSSLYKEVESKRKDKDCK